LVLFWYGNLDKQAEMRSATCSLLILSVKSLSPPLSITAKDNDGLISNLKRAGIIESDRIERAMKSIDRGKYVRKDPYRDTPQILGFNATISAP